MTVETSISVERLSHISRGTGVPQRGDERHQIGSDPGRLRASDAATQRLEPVMGVSIRGDPQNGLFIRANPIGVDDKSGYPRSRKPPYGYI